MSYTAVITGASRGIGRETAFALSSAGSAFDKLVLVARRSDRFEQTLEDVRSNAVDTEIVAIEADLANPDIAEDVFDTIDDRELEVNTIINNAGFTKPASINETRLEDFELTMRVNLYSPFRIIQTAIRRNHPLKKIINIASTAGMNGRAGWLSYSASKAAMINMSEVLRDELKPYNIDVVCLSPGRCATDLRKALAPDEDPSTIMQPDQVAEIIKLMTSRTGELLHSQNLVVRM